MAGLAMVQLVKRWGELIERLWMTAKPGLEAVKVLGREMPSGCVLFCCCLVPEKVRRFDLENSCPRWRQILRILQVVSR